MKRAKHTEIKDRLSDLPDSVLLHILSFLRKTQNAVQTSILSTRWRNLWKFLPVFSLYSPYFKTLEAFNKFISQLLSLHDARTSLHSLNFYLHDDYMEEPHLLERILKYAVSHNVKHLQILLKSDIQHFPSCFFSSHTLTYLCFYVYPGLTHSGHKILFPNSLNLPSLTHLNLGHVAFKDGAETFSKYPKLIWLKILDFDILGEQNLCISSTTLVKLTIQMNRKPKNYSRIELSTPSLAFFSFTGTPLPILCGRHFNSLTTINIDADMCWDHVEAPSNLLNLLLQLVTIKSLTVSSNTLQVYIS